MQKSKVELSLMISIVSVALAIYAAVSAWQSNQLAQEANQIAREANDISRESNRIAFIQVSPNPTAVRGFGATPTWVYGCQFRHDPTRDPNRYYVYAIVDGFVDFYNDGGRPAVLTDITLADAEFANRDWSTILKDENGVSSAFPVELEPGEFSTLEFVGIARHSSESEADVKAKYAEWYPNRSMRSPTLLAEFGFADGKIAKYRGTFYPSSPGLDFSRDCSLLENWSEPSAG